MTWEWRRRKRREGLRRKKFGNYVWMQAAANPGTLINTIQMDQKTNKIYFRTGMIGPIFYFLLLGTLGFLWNGYNPVLQSMSEIGSVVSPYKNWMNYLGFSLLGIVIVIFGIGVLREFSKGSLQYLSGFLISVAGVSMFAVGFFPCDAGCIDVTMTGKLHSLTSTVPSIALPLAAMVLATVLSRRWGRRWGYVSFWLGFLSMAAGPLMFLPDSAAYLGFIQRIGIGFSLLWMVIVSSKAVSIRKF